MKKSALLIIDMLNTLDFPDGEKLRRHAIPVAHRIRELKERLKKQMREVFGMKTPLSRNIRLR